jgi:hypothetical protein
MLRETADRDHRWRFACLGRFDRVLIEDAEDIHHVPELDQKLWAAPSCPTSGPEL